ncbi:hypothetical protein [Comamonas aquatica]|uniref:hypothetical protein n=1 Tax=Comamonas aquatica TaxID=225991 RepID=UPI0034D765E4
MSSSVSACVSRRHCLLAGSFTASALGLAGCATAPADTAAPAATPEELQDALVQRFYRALADGDFDRSISMVSARSLSKEQLAELTPKLRQMLAGAKSKVDAKGGLQKVEIVERVPSARRRTSTPTRATGVWTSERKSRNESTNPTGMWP